MRIAHRAVFLTAVTGIVACIVSLRASAADNVVGNLINFDNDGMWSWYMDERIIVDPTNGKILISANSSSPVRYPTGRPTGSTDVFTYDPATGGRSRFQLSDIDEDDHNAAGIIVLPDRPGDPDSGKYLAMYSNHGNLSMGDYLSRYRISNNPHDSSAWTAEQSFNWQTVTGWNTAPNANNRVSYHNLYYLANEDRLYNFSRGTHQSANALVFNYATNTWTWGGQLTTSSSGGYSTGYIKYASNGTDKIYFSSTETHPRNFNNNLWGGYISDGKTFDMLGNQIDANLFDNVDTGGASAVPDINTFTNIRIADGNTLASPNLNPNANGIGYHRFWTVDMALDATQSPVVMYIGRYDNNTSNPGNDTNIDHRIFYARWDGSQWVNRELARMGERLYTPEEDYTGNGALVPGDPNRVYISTQYDPRDSSGATVTSFREIYKGVTADGGDTWTWTPITSGSNVHNLRPIVPAWDSDHTAVAWFRGTYTTAQNTDAAIVGIIERNDETVSLTSYVDATTANTTRFDGTALAATGPSAGAGATDNNWHIRTGFGNGGDVLTADETSNESPVPIKTTLSGLADGTYDIFAYVWMSPANDWQIQVGFDPDDPTNGSDPNSMMLIRDNGAQQAEAGQFTGSVTLSGDLVAGGGDDVFLYRAYIGRKDVSSGSPIDVFVDDLVSTGTSGANRAWYDGLGYALVQFPTPGDFDGDDDVDADDIDLLCALIEGGDPDADLDGDSDVDQDDMDYMIATILETTYGDADLDGDVDGADFDAWRIRDSEGDPIGWATGDFDCDEDVDGADFDLWRERPTAIPGGAVAAVPEPATWLLAIVGFGVATTLRRRP